MPSLSLLAGLRYSVAVFPDLEAGDAGWCSSVTFTLPGASSPIPGGGTCGPADAGAPAITAGGAALANVLAHLPRTYPSGRKPKARSRAQIVAIMNQATQHDVFLNWFVVTDRVAAVKLNGTTVVPRHEQELTSTWRGIAAFTSGIPAKVVYLQHDGRPISPLAGGAPPPSQPTVSVDPRHLRATACGLSGTRLPGLASEWEVIAKTLPAPNSGVGAGVLFSCARAWYAFPRSHAVYSAAILLDAHNVAQRAPRLPGLTPDPHRGDYEEAHDDSAEITARRIGNAWLVVQGPSRRQREALLHDINATGTALHK